jgi:hypothetical protein
MPGATTRPLLPYNLAREAQKHDTHNWALRILDGLVWLSVRDRDLSAPRGAVAHGCVGPCMAHAMTLSKYRANFRNQL